VGILAGFLSTFWNFGYTRTARKMQAYLDSPPGYETQKIKKQQVDERPTATRRPTAGAAAPAPLPRWRRHLSTAPPPRPPPCR
jgi:hypothetical protein